MNKDNKNTEVDNTDKKLHISDVMPCISYLIDKNGNKYDLNKSYLEYLVSIQKDGTLKFQVVIKKTLDVIVVEPVYVV